MMVIRYDINAMFPPAKNIDISYDFTAGIQIKRPP
jgi:hypothetical protein